MSSPLVNKETKKFADKWYYCEQTYWSLHGPDAPTPAWAQPGLTQDEIVEVVTDLKRIFNVHMPMNVVIDLDESGAFWDYEEKMLAFGGTTAIWAVLHEFAHALVSWRSHLLTKQLGVEGNWVHLTVSSHGPAYFQALVDVIAAWMGDEAAEEFARFMRAQGFETKSVEEEALEWESAMDDRAATTLVRWLRDMAAQRNAIELSIYAPQHGPDNKFKTTFERNGELVFASELVLENIMSEVANVTKKGNTVTFDYYDHDGMNEIKIYLDNIDSVTRYCGTSETTAWGSAGANRCQTRDLIVPGIKALLEEPKGF